MSVLVQRSCLPSPSCLFFLCKSFSEIFNGKKNTVSAFPVDLHLHKGSGRINAPHGGTETAYSDMYGHKKARNGHSEQTRLSENVSRGKSTKSIFVFCSEKRKKAL